VTPDLQADEEKSTNELRAEVDVTREMVVEDIEALGDKLSAENIKAEAKQAVVRSVRENVDEAKNAVARAGAILRFVVRRHPVPVAVVAAAAVGVLVWRARRA
jgi:hypothetical protein